MDSQIVIVGSGLIGQSFAMLFASTGYNVSLYDTDATQLDRAKTNIGNNMNQLEQQGLLRGKLSKQEQLQKISSVSNLEESVKTAFYIQECVPEQLQLKKNVWSEIDNLDLRDDVILATSTSTILPSLISESLKHRHRFIVVHPTNPPYYAPATEVVPAPWTDQDVKTRTVALLKEVGQVPVVLKKEINGFVLNRIQYAILGETYNLIKEGVCDPEDCDLIMSEGLGRRYAFIGPWETAYLNADGMHSYCQRYAKKIHEVQMDYRKPELMEGATVDQIQAAMERIAGPVDQISSRREWRDRRLVALAQLKSKLDADDACKST